MTGRQVVAAVIAILLATAVLPPAAAYTANRMRVARAVRETATLAGRLRARTAAADAPDANRSVLCGPGNIPGAGSGATVPWVSSSREGLASRLDDRNVAADPWGNCYLANREWVLSAGPNGIVDTPFAAGSGVAGDDVGAPIR